MKTCTKCNKEKPKTSFYKSARGRDGLDSRCKECDVAASTKWRLANLEKANAAVARCRAANPERDKESVARYRAANREKIQAASAKYSAANRDKRRACSAKWYAENKDRAKASFAKWRADNAELRRIQNHNRLSRKRSNGGTLSKGLSEHLFKLQRGKCACCGKPLGDDYHLDHIMPLALGGTNTDDNIQLLRATCNHQKNAKHPVDFMQQRGFLL